jgi:hypothetical protein
MGRRSGQRQRHKARYSKVLVHGDKRCAVGLTEVMNSGITSSRLFVMLESLYSGPYHGQREPLGSFKLCLRSQDSTQDLSDR